MRSSRIIYDGKNVKLSAPVPTMNQPSFEPTVADVDEGPTKRIKARSNSRAAVLLAVVFACLCIVLTLGSGQSRVGDAADYTAMAWQFSHLRPPALTVADEAELDRHYHELGNRMPSFEASTYMVPALERNGRFEQLHFWIYPLMVSPASVVVHALNLPDTYAFAAFNILLASLVLFIVARRLGVAAAALLFVSPLLWWVDKPHAEVLMFCAILLALLWRRERPLWGMLCLALAAANNVTFLGVFVVYAIAAAIEHRRALYDSRKKIAALCGIGFLAVLHPLYYKIRLGVIDPIAAISDGGMRVPTVTRFVTPLVDPFNGLVVWWPMLVLVAVVGGVIRAWRRSLEPRTLREWVFVWTPFVLACAVLFAQAQVGAPESGGTFSMCRYALWLAPFAVYGLDHKRTFQNRVAPKALLSVTVAASAVLSVHVARPSLPDSWFTVHPPFVVAVLSDHAPWAWNSPPYIFMVRQWRTFTTTGPVANPTCTKLLAVSGVWPTTCPAPVNVPSACASSPYCYANRSGDRYGFVPVKDKG